MKLYTVLLSLLILASCISEKNQEEKQEIKEVVVKTVQLKSEALKDTKSYFGTLEFSKSTNFVAQQSGIITRLNVVPGQKVKQGEVIAVYPPMNHQLQIEQAKIQQNKTQQDYNRQKELYEAGAVTKVSVEDFKAQLDIEAKAIQQLQRVNIITAPFNGIITRVHANVGQEVGMGMPIFSMAQTGNVEVGFYVTPKDISEIKLNSPVFFMKDEKRIEGEISKKSIQLDERRRAYLVTATFDNNDILFVGSTVDILVETGKEVESVWIPIDTFRKQGNTFYVYVEDTGTAIKKEISIGKRNEQFVQITAGLKTGDQLIIGGIDKIKDSTKVIINP